MTTASVKSMDPIEWLPWSGETFTRAQDEQRPVLLTVGAAWCRWTAEMLRSTYTDPIVRRLVERRYIPVWVDADRRPDISERYTLGGWPTTAFLTPTGRVLGGETYVGAERMATLLAEVADAFSLRRHEFLAPPQSPAVLAVPPNDSQLAEDVEEWLARHLGEQLDASHGGFGSASKRVQAPAIRFALLRFREGDSTHGEVAVRTLDAIGWGGLYDDVEGGVFRSCAGRDWTTPSVEKLLAVNADALQVLLDGWSVLGEPRYRDRAADLIRYVQNNLVDSEQGGFFASQAADEDYYAAGDDERQDLSVPPVDRSVYTDGTARMGKAYIHAAEVFEDSSLLEFAARSLERVVLDSYQRGNGVGHQLDAGRPVRGLLVDQVAASDAMLDLYKVTDRDVYLDMAQELMLFAGRVLWDGERGGFRDRVIAPDDVGLLREPIKPFGTNCDAVGVLARLSRLTGRRDFGEQAEAVLALHLPATAAQGVDAARWVLAARELKLAGEAS